MVFCLILRRRHSNNKRYINHRGIRLGSEQPRQKLPSFPTLARARQFERIASILRNENDDVDPVAWLLNPTSSTCTATASSTTNSTAGINKTKNRNINTVPSYSNLFRHQQQLPLHILLQFNPPCELVELLIETLPSSVNHTHTIIGSAATAAATTTEPWHTEDMLGRTPLHTAVQYGCAVDVVQLLVRRLLLCPEGTGHACDDGMPPQKQHAYYWLLRRDYWGRSPLHWAVVAASEHATPATSSKRWYSIGVRNRPCCHTQHPGPRRTKQGRSAARALAMRMNALETRILTVAALVQACPDMVYLRDEEGRTPFEVARHDNDTNRNAKKGSHHNRSILYLLSAAVSTAQSAAIPMPSDSNNNNQSIAKASSLPTTVETRDDTDNTPEAGFDTFIVECHPFSNTVAEKFDDDSISTLGSGGASHCFVLRSLLLSKTNTTTLPSIRSIK